ncbi:hypothetical protein SeMB42_g03606 [Synchytrium endobioticum]|uniref:RMT2 domain-containing protein n=1 Tax=Synchytrium endobioticum TaxID=286115 RepID=A0A507D5G8_9FUNG|nr:hypothetical protein SeMB42_g03606 [Synchytrium endobioticum]
MLLQYAHPWNCIDGRGITAGEVAKQNGHADVKAYRRHRRGSDSVTGSKKPSNGQYLSSPVKFSSDNTRILDSNNDAVMMSWETPLMIHHASYLVPISGLSILNVGYGLGIIDIEFQKSNPASHTIIEAHPDVYKKMIEDGWDKKENVTILFGRWQDVLDKLDTSFDAIFFDTFGEFYEDLKEFHEHVPNLLSDNGTYSFFNGLGGHNIFFHDVYCRVAELDLKEMGIKVEYIPIDFTPPSDEEWAGVNRPYWCLGHYNMPICTMMGDDEW